MESNTHIHSAKENTSEELPSLIKAIAAHEVAGFDSSKGPDDFDSQLKSIGLHPLSTSVFGIEAAGVKNEGEHYKPQRAQSVSISMPPSPVEANLQGTIKVLFRDDVESFRNDTPNPAAIFYSQPMPKGSALNGIFTGGYSRINKLKDKNFDSFKTWSGKLERQISNFRGKFRDIEEEPQTHQPAEIETLPADRYFDALEGPELDTLRASEEIILPEDKKWPFLLRFPISTFGICLGVSSQAVMWKALASSASTKFLHVSPDINLVLWFISVALLSTVAFIYTLKIIFYFEAVRREYYHPVRVNFFFAPLIALLFLTLGVPPSFSQKLHASVWYVLMTPILFLEIKIYGQWMLGGERRLSKVANPSNHLSIVGNFVGALLGASMGLKEGPVFFFAVGLAHYAVLFVTLYQRLPTNETLPKELHPVFFLFVAAPSVASMAWATIQGTFGYGSRMAYFIGLFLYFSLAVRINFFRGFRFSLAWWAYTFPMTSAAIATIRYSDVVTTVMTRSFALLLCVVATLTVVSLLVVTIVRAFVLGDLLPNDIAIAIRETKPKLAGKRHHKRSGSSDKNTEHHHLKHANSADTDIEASLMNHPCSNNQEIKKCLSQSPS